MPFQDLELEFEDEDESSKKKNDSVQQDVDLKFSRPPGMTSSITLNNQTLSDLKAPVAEVKKIDEARAAAAPKPVPKAPAPVAPKPIAKPVVAPRPVAPVAKSVGSSALKVQAVADPEIDGSEVLELRERVKQVEFDAEIRIAVAEFKTEILSELLGDIKLLEHQIGQLLVRINAKHPDIKQEALTIKKLLADFAAKKRK